MQTLSDVFGEKIISGIWPACSPDLNPCDFFFWGCLKDKVYNSNPWKEELKENICREIANIPAEQLQSVNQTSLTRAEECLCVEEQHFQHLLWSVNCNYFISTLSANRHIDSSEKFICALQLAAHRLPWTSQHRQEPPCIFNAYQNECTWKNSLISFTQVLHDLFPKCILHNIRLTRLPIVLWVHFFN
jgi:hypothetical protein